VSRDDLTPVTRRVLLQIAAGDMRWIALFASPRTLRALCKRGLIEYEVVGRESVQPQRARVTAAGAKLAAELRTAVVRA
jgi:hypothetical protein